MARSPIFLEVKDNAGNVVTAASVTVLNRASGLMATIYSGETGTGTQSNPLAVDANGRISGWVERGDYLARVAGTNIVSYTVPIDAAPAGDRDIDTLWWPSQFTPTVGTVLPASPGDGDRFIWAPANALISPCEFRYRAAAATYKWEYMGGAGFVDYQGSATRTSTANVWFDCSAGWTGGSNSAIFTAPFAGIYDVEITTSAMHNVAASHVYTGPALTGHANPDYFFVYTTFATGYWGGGSGNWRFTMAAGDTARIMMQYNAVGAFFRNSVGFIVRPVAVI